MNLSDTLKRQLEQTTLEPIIIFQIDGVDTLYTSKTAKREPRYGDEGLLYGNTGLVYGGLVPIDNQEPIITFDGTTTAIKQILNPDKARGSGITSMSMVLVDIDQKATKLATGQNGEILFKDCKVWVGFGEDSAFNNDYILLFRGVIDSVQIGQGKVKFNLTSPDQKRRTLLLPKADTELADDIDSVQTTIPLDSVDNFFLPPPHPAYFPLDDDLMCYVQIEDEIIRYTGIDTMNNELTGCTRGAFFTTPAAHAENTAATTYFKIEGNAMELALKAMLSDKDMTPYIQEMPATSVNIAVDQPMANTIYFDDIDLNRDQNVRIGDYVKTSGSAIPGNNLSSWTEILDVVILDTGSYITVDASLTDEATTTMEVDFLSRWNSLGNFGIGMNPDEVDIEKHDFLRRNFLASFNYRFFAREEIEDAKEWIETELYRPASCYSLPADKGGLARLSVGLHVAPLPNESIVAISRSNVTKPEAIEVKRSINKNYYNSILVKYQDFPTDEKFYRKVFTLSGTLTIPTGNKTLVIESAGLKEDLSGKTLATASSGRLLERYETAAEFIEGLEIKFSESVQINVGDIILFDPTGLNVVNPADMSRVRPAGLWEVVNKDLNIKGSAKIDITNTAFNVTSRYGLFSPSSKVKTVLDVNKFVIEGLSAFPKFGDAGEYKKWNNIQFAGVKIRSADWSDVFETIITSVNFNTITLRDTPPFTILPGMIMEYANYDFSDVQAQQKLVYAFWTDGDNNFSDGGKPYVFI